MPTKSPYASQMLPVMQRVEPGKFCAFSMPVNDRLARHRIYSAANNIARRLWGRGNFNLSTKSDPLRLVVTRKAAQAEAPTDAARLQDQLTEGMSP
jgi:hypothetical protein